MPIQVIHYPGDPSVLVWEFASKWRWDEFREAIEISRQLARRATPPIDLILDLHRSPVTPSGGVAILTQMRRGVEAAAGQQGRIVVVAGGAFADVLIAVFRQAFPHLSEVIMTADSLITAYNLLQTTTPPRALS
jgi:hypothetical protein